MGFKKGTVVLITRDDKTKVIARVMNVEATEITILRQRLILKGKESTIMYSTAVYNASDERKLEIKNSVRELIYDKKTATAGIEDELHINPNYIKEWKNISFDEIFDWYYCFWTSEPSQAHGFRDYNVVSKKEAKFITEYDEHGYSI